MDNEQYLETALRVLCRLNSAPNQTLDPLSALTLYAGKTLQQGELPAAPPCPCSDHAAQPHPTNKKTRKITRPSIP
ncbi:MAG: hypothetical protein ACK5SQ_10405 [Chitinophagales bacterium]